jgi:hypothetical protein
VLAAERILSETVAQWPSRGLEKNDAIYETPTIGLVINFVRYRLSAFIGLVCRQRGTCYARDPHNGWNQFTRILKRPLRWVRDRVRLILDARLDDVPAASDIYGPIL